MHAGKIALWVFLIAVSTMKLQSAENEDIEEEDLDYLDYEDDSRARWSMFLPRFVEKWCYNKCKTGNKPFARMVGARCHCLCPLNSPDVNMCPPKGGLTSCNTYCKGLGYHKGGGCLYNAKCFCFCGLQQFYNASIVYTTSTTVSPLPTTSTTTVSPSDNTTLSTNSTTTTTLNPETPVNNAKESYIDAIKLQRIL